MSVNSDEPVTPEDDAGAATEEPADLERSDVVREGASEPVEEATVTEASVRIQRSPRYFRFMLTGAILLAIVALILTFAFPANPTYDRASVFGFLLAIGVAVGITVGAIVALLVDRAVTRRAHTVVADRIDVRVSDGSDGPKSTTES